MGSEPDLQYWLRLVRTRFRFLIGVGLGSAVLAFLLCFALPKTYRASILILPPHESDLRLDMGGLFSALRLPMELPFSSGVTLLDIYLGVLDSDTVARTLAERFDLKRVYKQSTLDKTLAGLRRRTSIKPTHQGLLRVAVEDRDPQRAADLANAYGEQLERVYSEARMGSARRHREFLEERLRGSEARLDSLHQVAARRQVDMGVTALSGDASEAALAAGELLGDRLAAGVRLQMLDRLEIGNTPIRAMLEAEVRALDSEIARLPEMGVGLGRDLRDLRVQEHLHAALSDQLETARIEEARDVPEVVVLDRARVPDRHVRPLRSLVTLAGLVVGLGLALVVSVAGAPLYPASASSRR